MSTLSSQADLDIPVQKYLLVLKRRWLPGIGVFGLVTVLATLLALTREPSYEASGKVLVRLDRTPTLVGLDTPGTTSIGEPNAVGFQSDPIATEVENIISLPIAEATIAQLNLTDDEGAILAPDDFFKALEVKPIPGTDMISITYTDSDPALAAAVVNRVIEVYRSNNIAASQEEAIAAKQLITDQLPKSETTVRNAEQALRQFKEQNQVVALTEESTEAVKAIQQLELSISQARAQLATATAQSNDLQRRLGLDPRSALVTAELGQSEGVQDALVQLRGVQKELDLARARFTPEAPRVAALQAQEANLQARLGERISEAIGTNQVAPRLQISPLQQTLIANLLQAEVERSGLANQINALVQTQSVQRSRASVFPRLEATQRELERRLTVAQATYQALLQRSQEVQVTQNKMADNVRVISQALVPADPSSSKMLIVIAGVLAGAILAVIVAFAIDLCDRSVKTVGEAKELLDLPILGVIPLAHQRSTCLPLDETTATGAYLTQAYRMLQANLSFVSSQTGCRIIVVTSTIAQEGRSWVAANLAFVMGQAGNKVLLVDADLRQSAQPQIWNAASDRGLIQVLEKTVELEAALQSVATNVSLLAIGKQSSNSLATFNTRQISSFIQQAAQSFDIVLIDTPPLTQTADASTLGTLADGTLMVIRPGQVKAADVKAAKGLLKLSGQHVLGMVVNGVKRTTNPSQYFAYTSDQATATLRELPAANRFTEAIDLDTQPIPAHVPTIQS